MPGTDGFETRAIHVGQDPDPATGAVVPPITLSSTFAQAAVGEHQGFEYARTGNPTRRAYEECLASLEGAAHGFSPEQNVKSVAPAMMGWFEKHLNGD